MNSFAGISLLSTTFVIYLTGCKKGPDAQVPEVLGCRITGFTYTIPLNSRPYSDVVSYNSDGNPSGIKTEPTFTESPHASFFYDKHKRLTDHIGVYGSDIDPSNLPDSITFEYWAHFIYGDENPASMPIGDTLYVIGYYKKGGPIRASVTETEKLEYDSQGRIITVTSAEYYSPRTYSYDANGNLILPIPNVYDNKKNSRLTNKVWMLVDKNFSKNNPVVAAEYNTAGFPTMFPAPDPKIYPDMFARRSVDFKTISYDCGLVKGN